MKTHENLTSEELSFAVFCIENLAERLNIDATELYPLLTEKSNILYDYIIPCYESLHTQGKDYILDDIIDVMNERGVPAVSESSDKIEKEQITMTANPILLQRKYARVIELFAEKANISTRAALDFFYRSEEYDMMRRGVSDLHCMSDDYLAEDLLEEWTEKKAS